MSKNKNKRKRKIAKSVTASLIVISSGSLFIPSFLIKPIKTSDNNKQFFDKDDRFEEMSILNSLDTLNKITGVEFTLDSKSILFYRPIDLYNLDTDSHISGYLIHFEDGVVIFDNKEIIFSKSGLFYYLSNKQYVFLLGEGIVFMDENHIFHKVDVSTGEIIQISQIEKKNLSTFDNVDGEITTSLLDTYVNEQHPSWSLVSTRMMGHYTRYRQFNSSFYYKMYEYRDGHHSGPFSEGNCAINAMANYFLNLPHVCAPNGAFMNYCHNYFPATDRVNRWSYFNSNQDYFYSEYDNNLHLWPEMNQSIPDNLVIVSDQWYRRPENSPLWNQDNNGYWFVRSRGIENGYTPEDGFQTRIYGEDTIEYVSSVYFNTSVNVYLTIVPSSVAANIEQGIPVILSANTSKSYGSHAMTIYGYAKYSYISYEYDFLGVLGPVTKYSYIWLVDDNWNNYETWYDPNRLFSDNAYIVTERNSLLWPNC